MLIVLIFPTRSYVATVHEEKCPQKGTVFPAIPQRSYKRKSVSRVLVREHVFAICIFKQPAPSLNKLDVPRDLIYTGVQNLRADFRKQKKTKKATVRRCKMTRSISDSFLDGPKMCTIFISLVYTGRYDAKYDPTPLPFFRAAVKYDI